MTKKQIEKKALECLELLDEIDIPIPIITVANLHGIEVHDVSIPVDEYGAITSVLTKHGDQWVILLNELETGTRKRFAIAHALGHFLLHEKKDWIDSFELGEIAVAEMGESKQKELEAHYFALCVLMPRLELKEAWAEMQNVKDLSKMFYTSHASMSARLESLGLVEGVV